MIGSPPGPAAELEKLQQETVQLRRELMRWKMLARQHEARVREMESSASWRLTAALRMLPEVRRRWKVLLLLGVLAVLSLPLWPLFFTMMLFARGRAFIWSMIWKIRPLHDLLSYVKQRIQAGKRQSRGSSSAIAPVVFRRPHDAQPDATADNPQHSRWQLLQQLCPQQRVRLERYRLSRDALLSDSELPELHSLSSAEIGMLRLIVSQYPQGVADQDAIR
jgi:hypothetical protein